uniref:Uncharacterized protein n=1 Tax=Arundo donax TaxID=35708 RepID=A0A0A8ZFA9_ARUDO
MAWILMISIILGENEIFQILIFCKPVMELGYKQDSVKHKKCNKTS